MSIAKMKRASFLLRQNDKVNLRGRKSLCLNYSEMGHIGSFAHAQLR